MRGPWCVPLATFAACAIAAGCAVHPASVPAPITAAFRAAPQFIRVKTTERGRAAIREVPLEEYVHASVISEVAPPSGDVTMVGRMLEVQSVLSRTYAIAHLDRHRRDGYDLCSTTHCQLYEPARLKTSRWAAAGGDAARRTRGTVVWFGSGPATALFHADCGGHTSTPPAVWGGSARPYLTPFADDGPASAAHATWRYEVTRDALRRALNADPRTAPGNRLDDITVLERDEAGRASLLRIGGQQAREVRGEVFRERLTRAFGARSIKSTWFDVREERASFSFEGRGFGHGVGLCQTGAMARLSAGASPANVLARYFPGTRLVTLR